jgi:hypothetical protein
VARHDPAIRKASTAKIDVAVLAWLTHSDPNQEPVRFSHLRPMAIFLSTADYPPLRGG